MICSMTNKPASIRLSRLAALWLCMLLYATQVLALANAQEPTKKPTPTSSSRKITFNSGLLAALAIFPGVWMCLFGYKWFRPTAFLCGFLLGGIGAAAIADSMWKQSISAVWLGFLMGGLVVGALQLILHNAGVCVVGTCAGVFLAFSIDALYQKNSASSHSQVCLIVLVSVFSVLGAVLAYKLQRPCVILATSFIGAELVVYGIGYFIGARPLQNDYRIGWLFHIPTFSWVYLVATFVLLCIGVLVQLPTTRLSRIEKTYRDTLIIEPPV